MSGRLAIIDLRTGSAGDIAVLDRLMAAAFDPRWGEAWTRNQCLGVLGLAGVWLTLAELDGKPAGFALARSVLDEGELLLLGTDPAARRRGVGGALLRATLEGCRARDLATLHLEVRANNEAVKLYRGAGFGKVGERRDYYRGRDGRTFDAHTYRRAVIVD
ncbi:GNAT family N-acetyltransferase [Sphingomonas bacterium]|uniref:GNAT family N-acetyltransferase n=1 Tax=Sphingomonas bacterium TaxID=1895847 RepID=UPI0020C633C1|nr:GNAT family N-acetyltransferase [Sphingomonas bacterium]